MLFWIGHGCCNHEHRAAMATCTRAAYVEKGKNIGTSWKEQRVRSTGRRMTEGKQEESPMVNDMDSLWTLCTISHTL